MATDFYKGHIIVSSARFNSDADAWTASVVISWRSDPTQLNCHQLKPAERFEKAPEAVAFGLKLGKEYVANVEPLLPEFEMRLKNLLEELFNPEAEFDQTEVLETCRLCSYKHICHR